MFYFKYKNLKKELYLVHDLGIGLSKSIWHVSGLSSELEETGMLTVAPFTKDLSSFLGLLHIH